MDWSSLSSSLIGAVVGGSFALAGTWQANRRQAKRDATARTDLLADERRREVKTLLVDVAEFVAKEQLRLRNLWISFERQDRVDAPTTATWHHTTGRIRVLGTEQLNKLWDQYQVALRTITIEAGVGNVSWVEGPDGDDVQVLDDDTLLPRAITIGEIIFYWLNVEHSHPDEIDDEVVHSFHEAVRRFGMLTGPYADDQRLKPFVAEFLDNYDASWHTAFAG